MLLPDTNIFSNSMNIYSKITFITMTAVLAGCMYINRTTSEFQNNITFGDLLETYNNYGESDKKSVENYLSDIIWPQDDALNHGTIDTIEIVKYDSKTLIVKA